MGPGAINPIGYSIPCHRVIVENGAAHRYRWGSIRKKVLIGYEAALVASSSQETDCHLRLI